MRVTRLRLAMGLLDAMAIRKIRNECRTYMTRDQSEIGRVRQVKWWLTRGRDVHPYLFEVCGEEGWDAAGYGIVLVAGERAWLTGGLKAEHRGYGLGETLFSYLVEASLEMGLRPSLEVLDENRRARALYRKLGFETVRTEIRQSDPSRGVHVMEIP